MSMGTRWEKLNKEGADLGGHKGPEPLPELTAEDVAANSNWMSIRGVVYDISKYLKYHPGGAAILEKFAGRDGTDCVDSTHPWTNIEHMMRNSVVGTLKKGKSLKPGM